MNLPVAGLSRLQATIVASLFIITLIGALLLAVTFRYWNARGQGRDLIRGDRAGLSG